MTGNAKITIAGAGHVGVTLAYACLIRGTGKTIALHGRDAARVRAEVLDLQHRLQFVPMATVEGSDDVEVCRGADVLVLTVGGLPGPGETRLDLAAGAVAACRDLLPRLLEVAPDAVVLIEAVLYDEHQVLPVSSLLTGYAGISDVCLSVPPVVSRDGVLRVLPVPLSEDEREGLRRPAAAVRVVLDKLAL